LYAGSQTVKELLENIDKQCHKCKSTFDKTERDALGTKKGKNVQAHAQLLQHNVTLWKVCKQPKCGKCTLPNSSGILVAYCECFTK